MSTPSLLNKPKPISNNLKDSGDLSDCDLVAESEIDEDDSSDDA